MAKALITGASSGIGMALARLLASKGWELLLAGRDEQRLMALSDDLLPLSPSIRVVAGDLSTVEGRSGLIEYIKVEIPDLVVNNAGAGYYGEILELPMEKHLEIMALNNNAVFEITVAAAAALKGAGRRGTILNVSSVAAFLSPFPGLAVYAATKAFVNHFSLSMDYELSPLGIRVLTACPGVVTTTFRRRAGGKGDGEGRMSMSADYAAAQLWWQIEKGRSLHLFDWRYRFVIRVAEYLLPRSWVGYLLHRSIQELKTK